MVSPDVPERRQVSPVSRHGRLAPLHDCGPGSHWAVACKVDLAFAGSGEVLMIVRICLGIYAVCCVIVVICVIGAVVSLA